MARKNSKARSRDKPRKLKIKEPKVKFLRIHKRFDDISPGVLVAVAEWKEVK